MEYLQPSLINESFGTIEKEILVEWKKNPLLHGFQLLTNYTFSSANFENLQDIQHFYNLVRSIVAQLSFLLFQPSLIKLTQQKFPLEDKLYSYTAVTVITASKEWPLIAEKVIKPHFFKSSPSFSENYDLRELNARPELIDLESPKPLFPETAAAIRRLEESYSHSAVVTNLKEYRKCLLQEI
jgi:hypothetical protein